MKHLEITFDLETCALDVNAAIMQIAAVAWTRDGSKFTTIEEFNQGLDLRDQFMMGGFTFDKGTSDWWKEKDIAAQRAVLATKPQLLAEAVNNFIQWIEGFKEEYDSISLWCQGADFDIPKLKHICQATCFKFPLPYTNVRCARTFALEIGKLFYDEPQEPQQIYKRYPEYDGDGAVHDALYDAKRTAYTTWNILHELTPLTATV